MSGEHDVCPKCGAEAWCCGCGPKAEMTSAEAWERFVGAMRHGSPFVTQQERAKAYAEACVREARAEEEEKRRLFREQLGEGGTGR